MSERYINTYPKAVLNNTKGYDTLDEALKNKHENIIDTKELKMLTYVHRNETLANERNKIAKKVDRGGLN